MRKEKNQDWLFGEHKRRDVTSENFDTNEISENDVELSQDAKRALRVLRSAEDSRNLSEFYKLACLELERSNRIDKAVILNDAMLPPYTDQSERFLLLAAHKSKSGLESMTRMRNSVDPAQLVLRNLHKHPVDVAIKMLRVRLDRLDISKDDDRQLEKQLRVQILEKTRNLEIFRDVLKKSNLAETWRDVEQKCTLDPVGLARELARLGKHPLARRVCDTFVSAQSSKLLLEEELTELWAFDLLTSSSSAASDVASQAFRMLESLESSSASRVCENILKRLGDRMLHKQLLLVRFLQQRGFGTSRLAVLELSLRVLTRLSASLASQLSHLIGKPELILESLLMANRLEAVKLLLGETRFVSLRNDNLSIRLAGKALEMCDSSFDGSFRESEEKKEEEEEEEKEQEDTDTLSFVLTGDETKDAAIRRKHVFEDTPSVDLAKSLLSLCASPLAAADAAVSFCDRLCLVSLTPMANQLIRHLLTYVTL